MKAGEIRQHWLEVTRFPVESPQQQHVISVAAMPTSANFPAAFASVFKCLPVCD